MILEFYYLKPTNICQKREFLEIELVIYPIILIKMQLVIM